MKIIYILIFFNALGIVIAGIWFYQEDFELEPLTVIIAFMLNVTGLIFTQNKVENKQTLGKKLKGKTHFEDNEQEAVKDINANEQEMGVDIEGKKITFKGNKQS
ncbi:hypothetical protein DNU06_15550 [Putridiphycobacter roseus]|uniref:Uncharacterized protein n=1 Tax=Putridiphycobacter roseus TaxID=2219161 RepID=A0A2W1NJX3_9FLAO|nr:hypothetical protein [Putridiphycobacter roseus]PZE15922.1 hypothetical protein DNU06_15550 [Putridiphycobacter roseus]